MALCTYLYACRRVWTKTVPALCGTSAAPAPPVPCATCTNIRASPSRAQAVPARCSTALRLLNAFLSTRPGEYLEVDSCEREPLARRDARAGCPRMEFRARISVKTHRRSLGASLESGHAGVKALGTLGFGPSAWRDPPLPATCSPTGAARRPRQLCCYPLISVGGRPRPGAIAASAAEAAAASPREARFG